MENNRDLEDERTELREDEKKLQIALQEYDEEWDFASDDDDENEEDRFLIDLEHEDSETAAARQSLRSGTSSVGSTSQRKNILVEDERSCDVVERQKLVISLPSASFDGDDLGSSSTSAADPEKTLALNRALQGILEGHIEAIQEALQRNKERQENLEDDITNPNKHGKLRKGPFRAPYFRVGTEYPEPNEDVVTKRQFSQSRHNILLGNAKDLRNFQTRSKGTLRKCVMQDCLEQILRPLMSKMEAEIQRSDQAQSRLEEHESQLELERPKLEITSGSKARMDLKFLIAELEESIKEQKAKVKEHKSNVAKLEKEIANKKNNADEDELLSAVDSEKVDWMRISKMNYGGNKTWVDCQKAWDHFVNPKLNTGLWTTEEKEQLKRLIDEAGINSEAQADWSLIAQSLGTGRTAFQCMSCYQRNFNTDFRSRPWTQEEDNKLIEEANKVNDSVGFFNWRKVSAMIDNRSPSECMFRFSQVDPRHKHGKFTPEEDAKLLAAAEIYGLRWKEIARFVNTRNAVQVRDRYMECLNPENNYLVFTYDEDLKLLKHHKQHGPAWAQITQYFQGRSAGRLGARFRQLLRWKKKKEWFDSQPLEVKRILLGKSLPVKDRRELESRIRDYFTEQLGINLEDYKRQTLDRNNGVDPDIIPPRPPFVMHVKNVKANMEVNSAKRWAKKISVHQNLRENLRRILKEEAQRKSQQSAAKVPRVVEEENEEHIVNRAVSKTLSDQEEAQKIQPRKRQLKKMEGLLAKTFHQGSSIFVSQIIETLSDKPNAKSTKAGQKHQSIDAALKNFFHQESRDNYKPGRARKFFERDLRSDEVVEEEKAELDRLVPYICLKSLGSSPLQVYKSARQHHVLLQEQLHNFPKPEEDPDFLVQEALLEQKFLEVTHSEPDESSHSGALRVKQRRLKMLKRIFNEKYLMELKNLKTEVFSLQEDLVYLQRLVEQTLPPEILASWIPGVTKEKGTGSCPDRLVDTKPSSACDSLSALEARAKRCKEQENSENSEDKTGAESQGHVFRKENEGPGDSQSSLKTAGSLRILSQAEIEEEKRGIELITVSPSSSTAAAAACAASLPCFPPNVATLTWLKTLLLKRGELLRRASPLTDFDKSEPKAKSNIDINEFMKKGTGKTGSAKVNESVVLVDSQGQMIDMNEFIEDETQDDDNVQSHEHGGELREEHETEQEMDEGEVKAGTSKHSTCEADSIRGRAHARGILSSNPQYNVANFSLNETSGVLKRAAKDGEKSLSVSTGLIKRATKDGEKSLSVSSSQGTEGSTRTKQRQQQQSGYELVVIPVANRYVKQAPTEETFLPPKPFVRTGKTYSNMTRKRTSGKKSQENNLTSTNSETSSRVISVKAEPSRSDNNQFDFPNLTHTSREVIEINQDSPDPKRDDTSDDDEDEEEEDDGYEIGYPDDTRLAEARGDKYEGLVGRLQQQHRKSLAHSNVVIVGVSEKTRNIVHYKKDGKGKKRFKVCETKHTYNAEREIPKTTSTEKHLSDQEQGKTKADDEVSLASLEQIQKEKRLARKLHALLGVRQSREYTMLRDRLRSIFMWPVLMSTVKQVSNPSLHQSIQSQLPPSYLGNKKGRRPKSSRGRPKGKMTKAERLEEHMKTEKYRRSQFMQQKRQERKEAKAVAAAAAQSKDCAGKERGPSDGGSAANDSATQMMLSEPVLLEDLTLAFPPTTESQVQDGHTEAGVGNRDDTQTQQEQTEKRGRGRVKGKKYKKKIYPPAVKRAKRNVLKKPDDVTERPPKPREAKNKSPPRKTLMELREAAYVVPQWWKDAMLAAMMAKQALGEKDAEEIPIEEDEDFIDKGNYSDDEWYQEWKAREGRGSNDKTSEHREEGP